jgi:hypothetical protein
LEIDLEYAPGIDVLEYCYRADIFTEIEARFAACKAAGMIVSRF